MKKLAIVFMAIFLSSGFIVPEEACAQNWVETFENGKIDWTTGVASAIGIGAPPARPINMAQARAMAKRAGLVVARRNLLEILKGVRVDSTTLVKDFVVRSDIVRNEVDGYLERSKVADIAYMSDGSVEVTVKMNLRGGLTSLMLPKTIRPTQPTGQPKAVSAEAGEVYTGLVVDSRGFPVRPAMAPRIVDADGNEVYGSSFVTRSYAIDQGIVGYTKDLAAAQSDERVADNPLTVKATGKADTGDSDIVIGNAEAAKIRGAAEHSTFLQKCRVMIVLD